MKKILLLAISSLLLGCSSFDETAMAPLADDSATQEQPKVKQDPYTLEVMRQAVDEVMASSRSSAQIDGASIEATHLYVYFTPKSPKEFASLAEVDFFILSMFPLDEPSPVTKEEGFYEPDPNKLPEKLYAIMRADTEIPAEIPFVVLKKLYDPTATPQGQADPAWAELVMKQAETITETRTQTKGFTLWKPQGQITVYDDKKKDNIPLEGVEVTYTNANKLLNKLVFTTDANGKYSHSSFISDDMNVSLSFSISKWVIAADENLIPIIIGPTIGDPEFPWEVNIAERSSLIGPATVFRAAYRYFYKSDLTPPDLSTIPQNYWQSWDTDFMGPVPTRLRIICQNNSSIQTDSGGAFGTYGFHEINIACKDLPTITMFVAATHELGHSAMDIYQIKHKLPDASDLICESWGTFTGYYMTFLEYTALGIYDDLFYQEPIPGTSETIGRPDGIFFRQMWKAPTSADSGNHYYTPIFVDMYDDYNQYEWFKIFSSSTPLNLVPNDNVVIRDARLIESIAFNTEESCPLFGKVMAAIYQVYPPNSRQDRARDFILPYISSPYLNYAVTQ